MATSRDDLLNSPRSGARPLPGSPGASTRTIPSNSARRPPSNPTTGRVTGGLGRASSAPASSPAPRASKPSTARTAPRQASPKGGRKASGTGATGPRGAAGKRGPGRPKGSRSLPGAPRLPHRTGHGHAPGYHNYQGIILAEFVAAEMLVSMTPIAVRKNQPGLSPYVPRDMTKLVAIGLVYFLLELAAVTGRGAGRFGAWFGLLILLTVGLNEAANVAKVFDLFAGVEDKLANGTSAVKGSVSSANQGLAKEIDKGLNAFGK